MRSHKYFKAIISILAFVCLGYVVINGASGTPSTLVVRTDANNYLLVTSVTQTNPVTQGVFSSRTLRTDANGSLQVVLTGTVTPTYPMSIPASTCAAPSLGESGAATTGIAFTATPSILMCVAGNAIQTISANLVEQSNGTTGQTWKLYRTLSGAGANYERGNLEFTGTTFDIGTQKAGTGSPRAIRILPNDTLSFTFNTNNQLISNNNTQTTSNPLLDLTQTWNSGAVTFTGLKLVITDTASAAGSLLLDLQTLASGTRFSVNKSGMLFSISGDISGALTVGGTIQGRNSRSQLLLNVTDGISRFTNNADNGWTRSIFGTNDTSVNGFSFEKDSGGHYNFARGDGSNGTLAVANIGANSCGTTAATIAGNDHVMVITVGATGGTACRVTFVSTWATAPVCVANNETTAANLANANASTTTTIDVTGTFVAGDKLGVICGTY